jgi:hypothetical protein
MEIDTEKWAARGCVVCSRDIVGWFEREHGRVEIESQSRDNDHDSNLFIASPIQVQDQLVVAATGA